MKIQASRLLSLACLVAVIAACGKPPAPTAGDTSPTPASSSPSETTMPPAAEPVERNPSPAGASVSFISPKDGDIVTSPVKVVFGLEGMVLAPAGDATPNSGHHHLLVDVATPDLALPLPKDAQHLHFGQAQTETEVALPPGQHTLQLVLGDSNHVPHNPPLISAPITITVQ